MSSSSLTTIVSKLPTIIGWAISAFKISASPATTALSGAVTTGRFLIYTTFGRFIAIVVILFITFGYFRYHFTAMERFKWEATVAKKQEEIINKVTNVNQATAQAQELARAQKGFIDRILAVVTDGIWKVQAPHPIESETIDLINETRGSAAGVKK